MTRAPRAASCFERPEACVRVRVTTMLLPKSGSRSNQRSRSRSSTTRPATMTAGGRMPACVTPAAIVARVPVTVCCPGLVPQAMTAAGVSGGNPLSAMSACAMRPRCFMPIRKTKVFRGS